MQLSSMNFRAFKNIFSFVLSAVIVGFVMTATAHAATSYPLSCRGGAGTIGYNSAQQQALMYFTKAPGPAGQGLTPGQCSWVDRAIGPNEPTCFAQYGAQTTAWIFPGNRAASYFNSTSQPWMRNLLEANNFQVFQVYNPGNGGCFVVTKVGF